MFRYLRNFNYTLQSRIDNLFFFLVKQNGKFIKITSFRTFYIAISILVHLIAFGLLMFNSFYFLKVKTKVIKEVEIPISIMSAREFYDIQKVPIVIPDPTLPSADSTLEDATLFEQLNLNEIPQVTDGIDETVVVDTTQVLVKPAKAPVDTVEKAKQPPEAQKQPPIKAFNATDLPSKKIVEQKIAPKKDNKIIPIKTEESISKNIKHEETKKTAPELPHPHKNQVPKTQHESPKTSKEELHKPQPDINHLDSLIHKELQQSPKTPTQPSKPNVTQSKLETPTQPEKQMSAEEKLLSDLKINGTVSGDVKNANAGGNLLSDEDIKKYEELKELKEVNKIKEQITRCWQKVLQTKSYSNQKIMINLQINYNPNGSVVSVKQASQQIDQLNTNYDRLFQDATEAINLCNPLKTLPNISHNKWQNIEYSFSTQLNQGL